MELRDYQSRAVSAVMHNWTKFDRLLGAAATGAGKTVIAAHVLKQRFLDGPSLFIAHREELLTQAIDKLYRVTGEPIGLERAASRAHLGQKIVVASVASLHQARLAKWDNGHFKTIIIDECHRAAARSYQNVLSYFAEAKCLGITATPDRSDQKSLATIFEQIAFEISLLELIPTYLAPIRVEQIPLKISLEGVHLDSRGDLDVNESAHALEPYLEAMAAELLKYQERKTLVFLPLVRLSKQFAEAARAIGLSAEHIDGESIDRREILQRFHDGQTMVLSCAALLTEGYDEPSVDCIVMLRPTQSRTLYCQCLGRGFRIHPGKTDLLVLDPLWLSSEHSLIRPANLVAQSAEEASQISEILAGGESDLVGAKEQAKEASLRLVKQRAEELARVLDATSKRQRNNFDPLEVASVLGIAELADFEPIVHWHSEPVSKKQAEVLGNMGVNPAAIQNKGQAHAILTQLILRRKRGYCTIKQLKYLIKYGHPDPQSATFAEASAFLDKVFANPRPRQTTFA